MSLLKCLHGVLFQLTAIQTYPSLPTLLAALKSNMSAGLPGQTKIIASIQPPLSIPQSLSPAQYQPSSPKQKPQSVAGPHSRRRHHRNKSREKSGSSTTRERTESGIPAPDHSSDSDSASASSVLTSVGRKERYQRLPSGNEPLLYSSSESDLSDSEAAPNRLKFVNGKIRFQSHSCLALIFQVLPL